MAAKSRKRRHGSASSSSSSSTMSAEQECQVDYSKGDHVLCMWNSKYYEAIIKDVIKRKNERVYKIHYHGWGANYDEEISERQAARRLREFDAELATQKLKKNGEPYAKRTKSSKTNAHSSAFSRVDPKSSKTESKTEDIVEKSIETVPAPFQSDVFRLSSKLDVVQSTYNEKVRQGRQLKIPSRVTLEDILNQYKASKKFDNNCSDKAFSYTSRLFMQMFGYVLRSRVLYTDEYAKFDDMKKSASDNEREFLPSRLYGLVHLLRFMPKLGKIVDEVSGNTSFGTDSRAFLANYMSEFFKFVNNHFDDWWNPNEDYE